MAYYSNCQARVLGNTNGQVRFYCGSYESFVFDWRISEQDWSKRTTTIEWKLMGKITSDAPTDYYADFGGMGYKIANYADDYPADKNVSTNGGISLGTQDNFRLSYGEDWKTVVEGTHVLTGALTPYRIATTSNLVTFQPNFFTVTFWWGTSSDYRYSTNVSYRPCLPFPYITSARTSWLDSENFEFEYYVPSIDWGTAPVDTAEAYITLNLECYEVTNYSSVIDGETHDYEGIHNPLPTEIGHYKVVFNQSEWTDWNRNALNAHFGDKTSIVGYFAIRSNLHGTGLDEAFNEAMGNPLLDYSFSSFQDTSTSIIIQLSDSAPVITATVEDVNAAAVALTGDSSKLILHVSDAKVTASAEGVKGATVQSITITHDEKSYEAEEHTFEKIVNNVFTISAKDNRNEYGFLTVTPDAIPYIPTTAKIVTDSATGTGELTVKVDGLYWTGNFGAVENSLKVFYRLRKASETEFGDWVEMESLEIDSEANTYEAAHRITGLDYLATYVIQAYALDAVGEYYAADATIATTPIFDWGQRDFNFNVPVTIMGSQAATKDDILPRDEQTAQLEATKAEINKLFETIKNAFSNKETLEAVIEPLGNATLRDTQSPALSNKYTTNYVNAYLTGNTISGYVEFETDNYFVNYTGRFVQIKIKVDDKVKSSVNYFTTFNDSYSRAGSNTTVLPLCMDWQVGGIDDEGYLIYQGMVKRGVSSTSMSHYANFVIPVNLNFDAFVPVEEEVTE